MIGHALVKPELTGAQVMEGLEPAKRYHLRRGAKEIDMVVAISKLLSREFQHVQVELLQMSELCHIAASRNRWWQFSAVAASASKGGRRIDNPPQIANLPHNSSRHAKNITDSSTRKARFSKSSWRPPTSRTS